MKKFLTRTISGAVYAILFIGSMYFGRLLDNPAISVYTLTAFLLFVTVGCTFEFFRIVEKQGAKPCRVLGYLYAVVLFLGLSLMFLQPGDCVESAGLISVVGIFMTAIVGFALAIIVQLWKSSEQPFRDAAYTMVPMIYIALPLGLMPMLHFTFNVLVMCVILVWVNDVFAYMGGSWLGKHKLWVRHSPGKTWEGTAIGAAFCIVTAAVFGPMFPTELTLVEWIVLGVVCCVIGTLGDLVESMLKRSVGVKDSGNIMPGHGGFLDRFDSLLMIAPFVFLFCWTFLI